MKKKNLKSLKLKKNTVSNFEKEEINGGLSNFRCNPTWYCPPVETVISCPEHTFVNGCHGTLICW